MKSFRRTAVVLMSLALTACSLGGGNPFLEEEWDTAFGVPPFDRIEDSHYLPAFRQAMAEHKAEIDAIANDPASPTFQNTIEALDRSGRAYTRVASVFGAVESAHSNDTIREVAQTLAPERAAHADDIALNRALFDRVKTVYEERASLGLTPEQMRLLEETHKGFVRSGIDLDETAQARLREINSELAELSQKFGDNLLAETNAFELHVTDEADLGDLPAGLKAGAADEAQRRGHDSGWSFTLQRPSIEPFLQYSPNRELRRRIYTGYVMRGDNDNAQDNKAILSRIAALRAERAGLMGYETHAHFVLSDNMAETPQRVYSFLDQIWRPALRVAGEERDALQQMMRQDGITGTMEGWDWRYYSEKVRKARYALDEETLRNYFQVDAVRDGVFMVATRLYGLTFTELPDLPRWHPDQKVFEIKEADGTHLGILYMDFFARESKQGGAWMNDLRAQRKLDGDVKAVVTTNFNFPPPSGDEPSLISFDDALTLAHEFGHALHGLMSDVTYESLSGTAVPRDFVEFPSQIMENWMSEPEVLRMYARHYRTGQPIPDELIQKIMAAGQFGQGFATVEYLAASYLDLAWHMLKEPVEQDARTFETAEMDRIGLIGQIPPRYRSGYFQHIFAGGYSAGYYAYIWAEVLDADAFQAFKETSLFNRELAARLREHVLSKGGTRPGMELYLAFRGKEPGIDALLTKRGLK
jgi:peptidyl-dipeptidase Dcp